MVAQVSASAVHLMLCILLVNRTEMGVRGLGFATMLTYFLMFLFTAIYALCIKEVRRSIKWPKRDSFTNWGDYLRISLPSTVMLLAEGWAFNVLGVLAGLVSVTDQAANTILLMFIAILFMVPMGISSAASAIIGEHIGANCVPLAKQYLRLIGYITLILLFIVELIFYFGHQKIVSVFTKDPAVE